MKAVAIEGGWFATELNDGKYCHWLLSNHFAAAMCLKSLSLGNLERFHHGEEIHFVQKQFQT